MPRRDFRFRRGRGFCKVGGAAGLGSGSRRVEPGSRLRLGHAVGPVAGMSPGAGVWSRARASLPGARDGGPDLRQARRNASAQRSRSACGLGCGCARASVPACPRTTCAPWRSADAHTRALQAARGPSQRSTPERAAGARMEDVAIPVHYPGVSWGSGAAESG